MKELTGISASPGIVVGKVFLYSDEHLPIPEYEISGSDVEGEIQRYRDAAAKAEAELMELLKKAGEEMGKQENMLLNSHLMMLKDPELENEIVESLKQERRNAEWVVSNATRTYIQRLKDTGNNYLMERVHDVQDVSKRVLDNLLYRDRLSLADLSEDVIVAVHNLLPSDTLSMDKRRVKGLVMDAGGKTSHTAILARSFEIPAVLGLSRITQEVRTGDEIIVDGLAGKVIVAPDDETKKRFRQAQSEWRKREVELLTLNRLNAETKDGKWIGLNANIEIPEETDSALAHGADGVGLYRSEFLFMQPGTVPSEEEQYEAYSHVVKTMEGRPVTIRTMDLGGDKVMANAFDFEEENPILGWRSIRFSMAQIDLFMSQLKALLRASVHGNLRIMFPMISGIEELERVLEVLEEAKALCRKEGHEYAEELPVGIMIEVPSAAMTADILAKKVDFFSIGTNDLIQYTIAVDRGNEKIAYLYEPFHPGVIRMLKMIIESAHASDIPVSMCGEMAADPYATVILLGLGLDAFSMGPVALPEVKKIVRSVTVSQCEEIVGVISDMKSSREINSYMRGWMNERFEFLSD